MVLPMPKYYGTQPDKLTVSRFDISAGANNRQHAGLIRENQVEYLTNADLINPGISQKRPGTNMIEDLSDEGQGAFGFEPVGQSNMIVVSHGAKLSTSTDASSFTAQKSDFTTDLQTFYVQCSLSDGTSSLIVQNMTDNAFEFDPSDMSNPTELNDTDSPVKTPAMCFYRNRLWTYKDEQLAFSDAAPATNYRTAMGNADFLIPLSTEVALVPTRDQGIFIVGARGVYSLNPAATPAATDKPEAMLDIPVPIDGTGGPTKTFKLVGDDVFGFFSDGVRAVRRTQEDKLQLGFSYPLSYVLEDEFNSVNWSAIHLATAVWWRNRYMIALPVDGSSTNNEVWVYYPATQGWSVWSGWSVADWDKVTIAGEERLFYIDADDATVYEISEDFATDEDNLGAAVAISYSETDRKEYLGDKLRRKNTGEVTIRAEATAGTLNVNAQFDDGGFQSLGTAMDLSGNLLDFTSWTLPFTFLSPNIVYKKYNLDDIGSWYQMQLRLTHTGTGALKLLERTIRAHVDQYIDEEEA